MAETIGKLHHKNLSETIGEELVRLIANGTLAPGQRLNEVHLSESFGVSRGPVREAARELEGQGLLVSRPRLGFYVANFSPREIVDLYEVKRWIDAALIDDFLAYATPQVSRGIAADLNSIETSDKMAFSDSLFAFRQRMLTQVHNRFLATQALGMYRQFHIVTALINAEDEGARITRILTTLRNFWAAMVEEDREKALKVILDDIEYWQRDVAPRFAEQKAQDGSD